ncbi:uncharacterized protein RCO7_00524 [Rhynchosporium graminicola]|uniref:Uncharacterized protein n=1 Tax=Rhynchosporium graminicola TaxID=2792576 RepID=A0A1E1KML9_9HELO|nr:uncharacterized protein RCO7_00524 [Rhynchosporium commune]
MSLKVLRTLAESLERDREIRLQSDLKSVSEKEDEYRKLLVEQTDQEVQIKIEHIIRKGDATVDIWKNTSVPFGLTQNGARSFRDAKLAELTIVEDRELKALKDEFERAKNEANARNNVASAKVEKTRGIEDAKVARYISRLSDGVYHASQMLGQIIEVEKMIHNLLNPHVPTLAPEFEEVDGEGSGGSIGVEAPTVERYGLKTHTSFGLPTPENTPPSSSESRFDAFEQPATPTPAPKKSQSYRRALPITGQFRVGGASTVVTTNQTSLLAARVTVSGFSGSALGQKVVIDLTSDTEDETPPSKRRQITSPSSTTALSQVGPSPSTPLSERQVQTPKRQAKKPINLATINRQVSPKFISPILQTPVKKFSTVDKKLEPIPEHDSVPARTPNVFDSDSDYSETEKNNGKKRHRTSSLEQPRIRSGKLLKGELLDAPGSELSSTKGTAWNTWAHRVYNPQKLLVFHVKTIWSYKVNGPVSKFNDDADPLGFFYRRRAHMFVPVIGHADKEDEKPEFVLEEHEIVHVQYNSEFALVCVTKNIGGQSDVVVQFGSRAELWDFLVVSKMEMDIRIIETLSLRPIPSSWFN